MRASFSADPKINKLGGPREARKSSGRGPGNIRRVQALEGPQGPYKALKGRMTPLRTL